MREHTRTLTPTLSLSEGEGAISMLSPPRRGRGLAGAIFYTFQWHRIVPHNARVRGWTITPSRFLNNQLDTVWLAE